MGEMLDWWLEGGDWYDRRQTRRIEEMEASHAAEVASVRSSISRQTSAIDARVDRLERALLAFVELEDTRSELSEFADAAAARRYARDLANRLLGADAPSAPPPAPADLPGYWLTPAVKAIVADLYPGSADAAALRADARVRDDEQAELFDVLVAALAANEAEVAGAVERWFPRAADLDRAQLAVCTEVARGRFGPDARATITARLVALRDAHDGAALVAHVLPETAARVAGTSSAADRAAAELERLAQAVSPMAIATDPTRAALRDDPLAELLAVLINEGAPGESPVLQRMAAIRASLAGVGVPAPPPMQSTGDVAGNTWGLVSSWLFERADPALHAVACAVFAPVISTAAASLESAAVIDPPSTSDVSVAGSTVVVGPGGADDASWQAAAQRSVSDPPGWVLPAVGGAALLALVAAVLGIAVAPGWWVLAVASACAAGGGWWWHHQGRTDAGRSRAAAVAGAQRRIDEQAATLSRARVTATERSAAARSNREAIDAAVAAATAASPA